MENNVKHRSENPDEARLERELEKLEAERKLQYAVTFRVVSLVAIVIAIVLGVIALLFFGWPTWSVWQQGMAGRGELARAEQNRQIAEYDAAALRITAEGEADRDRIRARGEADANALIGQSLEGEHGLRRLRYLQIEAMRNHEGSTIYVPTEAGMPIMEAGRRPE